ncbi:MAG: HAD hydrolase-like protein [Lachnospiraceae bacterium]|nr:HAD hydrolase-like protein [Lachnospiraceae bacterium]
MSTKYDIAIFDVDGTLLDTTEGVLASVERVIKERGLKPLAKEQLLTFIGPPIHDSFAKAYGLNGPVLQEMADEFRTYYKDEYLYLATPYEGVYETMNRLSQMGIKIAIATYKREDYARMILQHFSFDRYSDIMYGADMYNKLKKVDIIRKCMVDLGTTDCSRAVMIGDSVHDANGAMELEMPFLGVTYGFDFRTEEEVYAHKAIGCAHTPSEIVKYFE